MTLELTEGNWTAELAKLVRQKVISDLAQPQLTELIDSRGKKGILMSEKEFERLTAEVFTIKFPATKKKFILTHKKGRTYLTSTEW